jgi:AmiR/NasT family two-component response regulator
MFEDNVIDALAHAIVFDEIADKSFAPTCEDAAAHFKESMRKERPQAYTLKEKLDKRKTAVKAELAKLIQLHGLPG